ncbi:MAG: hypothetical protein ACOX17_07370 [Christensenellales bacterium]|jgi:hypothetical protein
MIRMTECIRRVRLLLLTGLPEGMTCQPEELTLLPGRDSVPVFLSPAPIVLCRPGLTNARKAAAEWAKRLTCTATSLTARSTPSGQLIIYPGDSLLYGLWKDCTVPTLPETLRLREESDPFFPLPFFYNRLSSLTANREDLPLKPPLEERDKQLLWHLLRSEALLSSSPALAAGWLRNAGSLTEDFLLDRTSLCHKTIILLQESLARADKAFSLVEPVKNMIEYTDTTYEEWINHV